VFRRRRNDDELDETLEDDLDELDAQEQESVPTPALSRPEGPWDEADAPVDEVNRVDLGALMVPVTEGHELRVDVDPGTGQIVSVTLSTPASAMQVGVFAAPRTAGIWGEVRKEISASLAAGGGGATSEEVDGPFGTELRAQVPTDAAGQTTPARFLGVDGPRWFLRAMLQGQAAVDPTADPGLLAAFSQLVVVRGADAMVVRDPLPLRLPADLTPPEPEAAAEEPAPTLTLPERGPEITEVG
jgi:hypothetical protein